ncbi:MAG TPA: hypothetical protein VJT11_09160 [Nitrospiraceae bacterium]|nr:hypothetical protein [Nitrospiraceae bacterium]
MKNETSEAITVSSITEREQDIRLNAVGSGSGDAAGWLYAIRAAHKSHMTTRRFTTVSSPALHQTALRVTRRLTRRSLSLFDAAG